jgi:hypothetical protein
VLRMHGYRSSPPGPMLVMLVMSLLLIAFCACREVKESK